MIIVAVMMLAACTDKMKEVSALDLEHYQPVDKFVPAYEALTNRTDLATNEDYDIEQTVRVINALEMAQANSKNFNEYLKLMAQQDYTGVAPDVIEAKQKLLPILQYMYKLQVMDEQLSDMWMLARSAASGGSSALDGKSIAQLTLATLGDPIAIFSILTSEDADRATNSAFNQYEKDKKLKSACSTSPITLPYIISICASTTAYAWRKTALTSTSIQDSLQVRLHTRRRFSTSILTTARRCC